MNKGEESNSAKKRIGMGMKCLGGGGKKKKE